MKKTTLLMIMDGFGCDASVSDSGFNAGCFPDEASRNSIASTGMNAIAAANTPNLDRLFAEHPHTILHASGSSVGLPDGQMGNSEVGHMNIGAGRIIYQDLTRITKSIEEGSFFSNETIREAMERASANGKALHLWGLLSDGGVHSHIDHLIALLNMAKSLSVPQVYVHCFLDGRDVPPRNARLYIARLEEHMKAAGLGRIATISGRYYAMDRDKRWDRVRLAYDAMTSGTGLTAESASEALANAYARDENDEFVKPTVILNEGRPTATVCDGDSIIMFNFRPDRAREITRSFCDPDFDGFDRTVLPADIRYVCMTTYDDTIPNAQVAFPPEHFANTLGEYVSKLGMTQLRLAETEKYAHVTFFFNGGVETPNPGEDRILVPSPKVATYDLQPEMSAPEVCDRAVEAINSGKYDLIIMNFANPDMVGHTGVFEAAVAAVETVDSCVGRIYEALSTNGGSMFITADHGNADTMKDADGNTITAHSTNPVPAILVTPQKIESLRQGILADIAPTLLDLMGIPKPDEMTGSSILIRSAN